VSDDEAVNFARVAFAAEGCYQGSDRMIAISGALIGKAI
jgi:hypothetical protein